MKKSHSLQTEAFTMHAGPGGRHVSFAGAVQRQPESSTDLQNSSHYASSSSNSSPARSDLHATIIEPMSRTVPLSSVPCQALGVKTAEEKAQKQGKAGHGSVDASTAVSNKTGRLSQLMEAERAKAEELKLQFNRPKQVRLYATSEQQRRQVFCFHSPGRHRFLDSCNAQDAGSAVYIMPCGTVHYNLALGNADFVAVR